MNIYIDVTNRALLINFVHGKYIYRFDKSPKI